MKNYCLCLLIILFSEKIATAQGDSLRNQPAKKTAFLLALDSRNTFLALNKNQNNAVNLYGIRLGMRYKKWKYWLGLATISANSQATQRVKNLPTSIIVNRELSLRFVTLTPEYIFFYRPYLELSVPLEFGIGSSNFKQINERGIIIREQKGLFVPVESGLNVLVKPTRWVGAILRGGYRKTINVSGFEADYDGWYYSYGAAFFLGNIYKDLRKKPN